MHPTHTHTAYMPKSGAINIMQWPHITLTVSIQALTNCSLTVDADATLNTLLS